jgi:hypothetical protein
VDQFEGKRQVIGMKKQCDYKFRTKHTVVISLCF